jgi:polysaccharide export outer membrane protein
MRRSIIAFILLATIGLNSCGAPRMRADLLEAFPEAPYTLSSGDRLRVIVFGQDALSNSYSVDGAGRISLPLIGLVAAQGMTTANLERAIESRLRNGYLREPKVSVEVEAYRPFYVLGEVTTAGQYPFVNGLTVQKAVAIAGGFGPRAARWTADVTRVIEGVPATASVPLTFPVRPGDTITVRERFF